MIDPIDEATHTDGKWLYKVTPRTFIFAYNEVEFWDTYLKRWSPSIVSSCNLVEL